MTQVVSSGLAQRALEASNLIIERLSLQGEIRGGNFVALNPTRHDNKLGSFSINLDTGKWADFAVPNASGSNIISYCAYVKQITYAEAFKWVKAQIIGNSLPIATSVSTSNALQVTEESESKVVAISLTETHTSEPTQVLPVPSDAPSIHSELKSLNPILYAYNNLEGQPLFYVVRIESKGGKSFFPYTLWKRVDGSYEWKRKGIQGLRPLFNLHKLRLSPEAPVLLVEGEKAALAAESLFPNHVVMTSSNGAQSASKTDFTPILGRQVYIWPDFDESGEKYAVDIIQILSKAGYKQDVCVLDVKGAYEYSHQRNSYLSGQLTQGWDIADARAQGWTSPDFDNIPPSLWVVRYQGSIGNEEHRFGAFKVDATGVYQDNFRNDINTPIKISSSVLPLAITSDLHGENWGKLLEVTNPIGVKTLWTMQHSSLSGNGEPVREAALYYGAMIFNNTKFIEFLMKARPEKHVFSTESTGWHQASYVLPNKTYGKSDTEIIFQKEARTRYSFSCAGDLNDWKNEVAKLCSGNSRLILAVSSSLAGPFLKLLDEENGGIHFRGASSTGKTKTLQVAASVWGGRDMVKVWRTTDNAIESTAINHNDAVLLLDELGQVEPDVAGGIAYCLGNGQQKARSSRNGSVRAIKTWRLLFISTGEVSLVDHISSAGGVTRAGMEVRMMDIPADAGAGMGIFENIHGYQSPAEFADAMESAAMSYYGTAADALLERLTDSLECQNEAIYMVKAVQSRFIFSCTQPDSHGQVKRVASRLGMIAGVGEYCIRIGILPWSEGEASDGCLKCFKSWQDERGGNGATEEIRALSQVRLFLEQHGESRFTLISGGESPFASSQNGRTLNRVGYRRVIDGEIEYIVTPEAYRSELCKGLDARLVTKVLLEGKHLQLNRDGSPHCSMRLPDTKHPTRVYIIKSSVLGERAS